MGLFDMFKKKPEAAPMQEAAEPAPDAAVSRMFGAPVPGKVMVLEDVPDPVFSTGMLGKGCGIVPEAESVVAPADAKVTMVTPTAHAIGLTTADGVEVLMHIGIDTVNMKGDGFAYCVAEGDEVKLGQQLITFDREKVKASGYSDVVIVVVSNAAAYAKVALVPAEGTVVATGVQLISVRG